MAKFHINPQTGDPSACRSTKGKCPFGSAEAHFTSKDAALKAYEQKFADIPAPTFDGSSVRFQELTSPLEIEKLAGQLKSKFDYNPNTRVKINDRHGFGLGVNSVSFDPFTKEYAFSRRRMATDQVFTKSKSLAEVLSYAAQTEGYRDDQYEIIDWDA